MNAYAISARPRQRKRLIIVILAVLILFALLIGFNTFKGIMMGKFMVSMANPPQTVSTMIAEYQAWQPHVEAVGDVRAVHGADLAFDVAGLVESVDVKSGADVDKGQVLVRLVDADDRGKLASLQATAQLAKLTAGRARQQLAVQAISKAQYDTDMANLKGAQANVAAQQALVDKKTLRAPFSGRIGIITVNPGDYIKVGTAVVTLQQLDPVYVDFTVPQSSLDTLKVGGKVEVSVDAFKDKTFNGKVSATAPKVDLSTRNAAAEAIVANPDKLLVPGMFARIAANAGATQRYLTLPQTAVAYAPYGDTVFVVHEGTPPERDANGNPVKAKAPAPSDAAKGEHGPSHYATLAVVTLGPRRGDQVAILSGIKQGDVIVTSGQLKLRNDTPVDINNKVQPAFDPNPHPVEQ
ncbi:MAG: efflux RND transporter periplasmic adaptor subunit [Xanthomonadaceae bacterium]|nr:efflux RND transporter periplasmic adaptor subunit [Xanthomonadaceae bacterium]MDE2245086.1 efflux RND transporter periplasmic adaptor subunit [Xanthomonadaceae bacterium]